MQTALAASYGPTVIPLPAANGTDDTTALQAVLTAGAGKRIAGRAGSVYKLSAPLVISSGTRLDMTGCEITYAASVATNAGFRMIHNVAAYESGARDTDIHIKGGYWNRGTVAGDTAGANEVHARITIQLHRVDRCSVTDIRYYQNSGSKFAVWFADVTYASAERCDFISMSDGVHVTGPAQHITIRDISGDTDDDLVVFTGRDYTGYEPTVGGGDISDVLVERVIHRGSGTGNCVMLLPGSGKTLSNVRVNNVGGTTGLSHIQLLEDSSYASTTGGTINDVVIDGVSGHPTDSYVEVSHSDVRNLTIRNVSIDDAATLYPISFQLAAGAYAKKVTIDGVKTTVTTPKNIITVHGGCTVDHMTVIDVDVEQNAGPGIGRVVIATGNIGVLKMSGINQIGGQSVICPETAGTIPLIFINDLTTTTAGSVVFVNSPGAIEVVASGAHAPNLAGAIVYRVVDGGLATLRAERVTGATPAFGGYTAARTIRGIGVDVRVDCFRLTPVQGDIVTNNTNSDVAGYYLGPVIYDAAQWIPLRGFAATGDVTLGGGNGHADVGDARITATSRIRLFRKTVAGTPGALYLDTKTVGSGFRIWSTSATDTSVIRWEVIRF